MSAPRLAASSSSSAQQPAVTVQRLPPSSPYAVPTRQLACDVEGKHTEVVIQEYHDRTFVVVTQLGRVGILMQASLPADTPYIPYSSSSASSSTSNYDFEYPDSDSESGDQTSRPANGASAPPTFTLPTINPSLVHTSLLGTPPPGQAALYTLYVSSIHALMRSSPAGERWGGHEEDDVKDLRPVVVGLGLGLKEAQEEEVDIMAEEERGRFVGVLELVRRCREEDQNRTGGVST